MSTVLDLIDDLIGAKSRPESPRSRPPETRVVIGESPQSPQSPEAVPEVVSTGSFTDREAFEERAAIREYGGGYSREDAELLAAWEMAQARFARLSPREWLARYTPDRLPAGDGPANYPIAQVKPGIDFWLIREQRRPVGPRAVTATPRTEKEAELRRLVRLCGIAYGFSEDEHREALQIALGDPENALTCFRAMAAKLGVQ